MIKIINITPVGGNDAIFIKKLPCAERPNCKEIIIVWTNPMLFKRKNFFNRLLRRFRAEHRDFFYGFAVHLNTSSDNGLLN